MVIMEELFKNWNKFLITESEKNITIKLPKFRISEQWGTPGSDDRQIIEMFTKNIVGTTIPQKISSLNTFVSECDAGCVSTKDVSEILANLVFLDSMASVIYDFNPQTGGFLFESLMSALLGGKAKQVPTGAAGSDQDVIDMYDDQGRPMSLKFFFEGASQYVEASYDNLVADIEKNNAPIVYLIGIKNRATKEKTVLAIDFYEFTVGSSELGIDGQFDATELGYGNGLGVGQVIGTKKRGRARKGEEGQPRTRQRETDFYIATLDFGDRNKMKEVAQNYATRLGSVLIEIYEQIDLLSKNVNTYFLASPEEKDAAIAAKNNADTLQRNTEELM